MDIKDIKDIKVLVTKAFPKSSEEEISTYFREVHSYISRIHTWILLLRVLVI